MKDYIRVRVLEISQYIIQTNSTVRDAARVFNVSKSTVHKDVTERLEEIDIDLASKVRAVLNINLSERHIRGGIATQKKFKN